MRLLKRLIKKSETIKEKFNVNGIYFKNREAPFIYIDGKIMIGQKNKSHHQILKEYFNDINEEFKYDKTGNNEKDLPLGFGSILIDKNNIKCAVIDTDTLFNVDYNTMKNAILSQCSGIKEVYLSNDSFNPDDELKRI